jgi:alkanesulfonate monooxygenase SsuD/methylene tetrahydromethanopterin reductase-like flavin-dependent oxidoreductase (luciferase family)
VASCVIVSVSQDREQARREARQQVAFYSTVRTYDLLLDSAGFTREKDRIRSAFKTVDIRAMAESVSDEMLAATAIAGTPEECGDQFAAYDDLLDLPIFYPPTFGVDPRRVLENHRLIVETFAAS